MLCPVKSNPLDSRRDGLDLGFFGAAALRGPAPPLPPYFLHTQVGRKVGRSVGLLQTFLHAPGPSAVSAARTEKMWGPHGLLVSLPLPASFSWCVPWLLRPVLVCRASSRYREHLRGCTNGQEQQWLRGTGRARKGRKRVEEKKSTSACLPSPLKAPRGRWIRRNLRVPGSRTAERPGQVPGSKCRGQGPAPSSLRRAPAALPSPASLSSRRACAFCRNSLLPASSSLVPARLGCGNEGASSRPSGYLIPNDRAYSVIFAAPAFSSARAHFTPFSSHALAVGRGQKGHERFFWLGSDPLCVPNLPRAHTVAVAVAVAHSPRRAARRRCLRRDDPRISRPARLPRRSVMARDRILTPRLVEGMIADGRVIVIFEDLVLQLDSWMSHHPGGRLAIQHMVGKDATDEIKV